VIDYGYYDDSPSLDTTCYILLDATDEFNKGVMDRYENELKIYKQWEKDNAHNIAYHEKAMKQSREQAILTRKQNKKLKLLAEAARIQTQLTKLNDESKTKD
jgi:spore germination cell wall hydrolase CwlJ-like protein